MFSDAVRHIQNCFPWPIDPSHTDIESIAQIQSELLEAVEGRMVSTRSHDHTHTNLQIHSTKPEESHSVLDGRQKAQQDPSATLWRKKVKRTRQHAEPIPTAPTIDLARKESDYAHNYSQLNHNVEGPLVQRFSHVEVEQIDSILSQELLEGEAAEEAEQPDDKLNSRKIPEASETFERNAKSSQNGATIKDLKGTHTRFSSESLDFKQPELVVDQELNAQRDETPADITGDESDYQSEDEAPETLTAATGFDEAHKAAAEIAKLEESLLAATKKKRKELDDRLKSQAQSAKKRRIIGKRQQQDVPSALDDLAETVTIDAREHQQPPSGSRKAPLPALLPDEILAAEPVYRSPNTIATSRSRQISIKSKIKMLDRANKPPKDIKRGSVRIRVLEDDRGLLPPKASISSKRLRESWLTGRGESFERGTVPRRKLGGGFVRK